MTWVWVRARGGALVLRVEDIDTPRVKQGACDRQLEDLRWLELDWDEGPDVGGALGPYRQSERKARYDRALAELAARELTYLCDCSRADIARAASAPHEGEEGPRYPGTCREFGMLPRSFKRDPAVRLKVEDRDVAVEDVIQGSFVENVAERVGDFVLRRGDGVYAYQLAVVVDDLAMGITDVVRGADLLGSTARQILLAELLGGVPPRYAHHAMIVTEEGGRLAKRAGGATLRAEREAGVRKGAIVSELAVALGLAPPDCHGRDLAPRQLVASFDPARLVRERAVVVRPRTTDAGQEPSGDGRSRP